MHGGLAYTSSFRPIGELRVVSTAVVLTAEDAEAKPTRRWRSDSLDLIVTPALFLILSVLLFVVWNCSEFDQTTTKILERKVGAPDAGTVVCRFLVHRPGYCDRRSHRHRGDP